MTVGELERRQARDAHVRALLVSAGWDADAPTAARVAAACEGAALARVLPFFACVAQVIGAYAETGTLARVAELEAIAEW